MNRSISAPNKTESVLRTRMKKKQGHLRNTVGPKNDFIFYFFIFRFVVAFSLTAKYKMKHQPNADVFVNIFFSSLFSFISANVCLLNRNWFDRICSVQMMTRENTKLNVYFFSSHKYIHISAWDWMKSQFDEWNLIQLDKLFMV